MTQLIILAIALTILYYWRFPYKIISHCDGDTSWAKPLLGKKFKVRYAVIDANELRQFGGKAAKQYLTRILPIGSRVAIISTSKRKSYDREMIGIVYKGFININLAMIAVGYAVIDHRYLHQVNGSMQRKYINAQNKAKKHKLGRWSNPQDCALMPWEYRKLNKR